MTILNIEGVGRYKGLRVSDLEPSPLSCFRASSIERLRLAESGLVEKGYGDGLPCYIAYGIHIEERSIQSLAKEVGVCASVLAKVFDHYNIPKLTGPEAKRRQFEDPEFRRKMAEAKRKSREKFNDDEESLIIRKVVVKTYDGIALHRDIIDGWRSVVPEVSEITGLTKEVVEFHLVEFFKPS